MTRSWSAVLLEVTLAVALAYLAGFLLALVRFPTWEAFVGGCAAGALAVTFEPLVRRRLRR